MVYDALRALPRDAPNFHQRQASHLRALAATTTTQAFKAELLSKAEEHEVDADIVAEVELESSC
jgi:hypothetical protein